MTLIYKPVDPGHVPAHVRNAFAERFPSNPPKDEIHLAPGWHWQTQDIGTLQRYHWLRSPDEKWSVATVEA